MKTTSQSYSIRSLVIATATGRILLGLLLAVGTALSVHAQGQIASGTISSSGSGPSYTYSLSFSDAPNSTSPIGSIWYAWVPGVFYLPGIPTSASAPAGWTATVDANSVQYIASPGNAIAPGSTLSGFGYQANFSPAQLAAAANSGVSVAYSGGLFSDAGNVFTVQAVTIPEPSTLALLVCGGAGLYFISRRRLTVGC